MVTDQDSSTAMMHEKMLEKTSFAIVFGLFTDFCHAGWHQVLSQVGAIHEIAIAAPIIHCYENFRFCANHKSQLGGLDLPCQTAVFLGSQIGVLFAVYVA